MRRTSDPSEYHQLRHRRERNSRRARAMATSSNGSEPIQSARALRGDGPVTTSPMPDLVYISQRLEEVFLLADRVSILRDGQLVSTQRVSGTNEEKLYCGDDQPHRPRMTFPACAIQIPTTSLELAKRSERMFEKSQGGASR